MNQATLRSPRLAIAATSLAALIGTTAAAQSLTPVTLQTDWIPSGEHAMYYGGWSKGIFEEHGLDITITRGYGSGDTVTKLAGGAFDFGVADLGAVLAARARSGMPVVAIAALYTHSPHSLFVLESSGITDFQGLEGKRIGITPGNSHRLYFPNVAERAGTDPRQIIWVNTDGAAMAPLLIQKQLDAAPFYSIHHYYQNKAAEAAGEKIVVLPFEEVGFAIYAASLVTTEEMIEENPELVGALPGGRSGQLHLGPGQPRGGLRAACRAGARGRLRRLHGQPRRDAHLRLQRALGSDRARPLRPRAPGLHLGGRGRGAGDRSRLGSDPGRRHQPRCRNLERMAAA